MNDTELALAVYASCSDMDAIDYAEQMTEDLLELQRNIELLPQNSALRNALEILVQA